MKPRSVSFLVTVTLPAALIAGLTAWFLSQTAAHAQTGEGGKQGTVEMIKVHGKSLEGNLEGDSPDRDVYVYLPPSYATDKTGATQWCISCTDTAHMPRCTGRS